MCVRAARLFSCRRAEIVLDVAEGHGGADVGERLGRRAPDSRRRAGDDRGLSVEVGHGAGLYRGAPNDAVLRPTRSLGYEGLMELSGIGSWSGELRYGDEGERADAAAELESLGYTALWIPDVGGDVFGALRTLLDATNTIVAATGILNLWMHSAGEVGDGFAALESDHQ